MADEKSRNVIKPPSGSSIAIFGGGAVGMAALLAAQLTDPGCIVLVDNSQAKLDIIPKSVLGPNTHLYNSGSKSNDQIAADIRSLSPGGHGMDYALDCVGNENVLIAGHAALDKLGTLVTIGSGEAANVAAYSLAQHLTKGVLHRGTHQGDSVPRDMIPKLFGMWKDGQFPFEKLLTQFKFEDIDKALEEMHMGKVIKPVLVI